MSEEAPHQTFEYRVVPAPRKGEKAKGVRSGEARFALAMSRLFNRMGAEGWEYVRADTLPAEERVGFAGSEIRYHALLVFRRALPQPAKAPAPPEQIETPTPPLMLTAPQAEWQGFVEADVEDAVIIDILSARAETKPAAE